MNKRSLIAIGVLAAISAVAFLIPYSFDARCAHVTSFGMAYCFFRNAGVTLLPFIPMGLALLLLLAPTKHR